MDVPDSGRLTEGIPSVTREFGVSLQHQDAPDAPIIKVTAYGDVSIGQASEGRLQFIVLGSVGKVELATRMAERMASGPFASDWTEVGTTGAVIVDHRSGEAVIRSACIGQRHIYWACTDHNLAVASAPSDAIAAAGLQAAIRPGAIYDYVYFHCIPGPACIFEGINKLPGGHQLSWNGAKTSVTRYWRPRFDSTPRLTEEAAAGELRSLLTVAVGECLASEGAAGAFLSGGLDSSTVAGLAAGMRPGIPTVTMGFDAAGYDEMQYARIAARHFGTTPLEYYVTPDDVAATLPAIAAAYPEPFGNSSAAAVYHCARIAREHGLLRLLAGDGGDELFGGNERYAKQLVFERYQSVPDALRRGLIEPAIGAAAKMTRAFPVGKAISYIQQANVPLPDRLQTYNFLHRHDPAEVFAPELLERIDIDKPMRGLRDEYQAPETDSPVNRMLFLDWKYTLHDNDLVKVGHACRLGGVDVAFPMLDPALLEFSLKIPHDWKVRGSELRWFYKRAMADFLPREIIRKTKHGFGLPFGAWTRTHAGLAGVATDALESLGHRGYFKREFLHKALQMHRDAHASYYGELVWILTVLELWLKQHLPAARL